MANAGYSNDYSIMNKMVKNTTYLKDEMDDCFALKTIKQILNRMIEDDVIEKRTHHSSNKAYDYIWHSAWTKRHKAMIKITQVRQKNWYWEPLKIK